MCLVFMTFSELFSRPDVGTTRPKRGAALAAEGAAIQHRPVIGSGAAHHL
ncbi:hypothetical protein Lokhon_02546 [Limimaricola hongkongensis DSM 17492]|uniref:Uncharacterized protein n=1 Tax=Limimaricola hongkongensis DSM 17492 TaxID=1122180 RepID=A0A017H8T0_9RHOB|nr:hypothetical protein Lokhon_02546 [Limimaricola hongkongensis DSM 17492]